LVRLNFSVCSLSSFLLFATALSCRFRYRFGIDVASLLCAPGVAVLFPFSVCSLSLVCYCYCSVLPLSLSLRNRRREPAVRARCRAVVFRFPSRSQSVLFLLFATALSCRFCCCFGINVASLLCAPGVAVLFPFSVWSLSLVCYCSVLPLSLSLRNRRREPAVRARCRGRCFPFSVLSLGLTRGRALSRSTVFSLHWWACCRAWSRLALGVV